jgi:DNA-binding NarL/FixJ family response regulator
LVLAEHAALQGRTFITPDLASEVFRTAKENDADPLAEVTPRQREIVQLLAEGKSAKEIAVALSLSARTVEFHKYTLMDALHIENSAELIPAQRHRNDEHGDTIWRDDRWECER